MTKTQALNRAVRQWGKDGAVKDRGAKWATDAATREAARVKLRAMPAQWIDVEPMPTDDKTIRELKDWQARGHQWREERRAVAAICNAYRFSVGVVTLGMFFEVKGEGDTWEEAFAAAEKR